MGYMGFGLQKWIYNLKPRRPFKKRGMKVGYDVIEVGATKKSRNERILSSSSTGVENRISETKKNNIINAKLNRIRGLIVIAVVITLITVIYIEYRQPKSEAEYNYTLEEYDIKDKEKDVIALFLKSGIKFLEWNQIESAQERFERALEINPENIEALKFYVISLTIDCEENKENCDKAIFYFEKMKKIDESKIPEVLKLKIEKIKETFEKQ